MEMARQESRTTTQLVARGSANRATVHYVTNGFCGLVQVTGPALAGP